MDITKSVESNIQEPVNTYEFKEYQIHELFEQMTPATALPRKSNSEQIYRLIDW